MSSEIINIGVIGTNFGGQTHVPAFQNNPQARVIGICGRDITKTKTIARKLGISFATTRYQDLLKRDDIDVITVSTPPRTHNRIVLDAIRHGKHVLCEKPFGLSSKEAKASHDAAKKAKIMHAVSYQMRFQLQRMAVKNILSHGDLGKILHVNFAYSTSNRVDSNIGWNWWSDEKQGGGELYAMGSHQIDLLRWWFGEVKSVTGDLKTFTLKRKDSKTNSMKAVTSDELAAFQLIFKSGVLASCAISSVAIGWRGPQIQIYGDKGSLFIDGEQNLTMERKTTARHDLTVKDPLLTDSWVSGSEWRSSFARMADNFLCAVKGEQSFAGATFQDGLAVQKIMEAIKQSSKSKNQVSVA